MKPSKHIIVTGGAGFIGSHLVERLLADDKTIIVIDDLSTGNLANLRAIERSARLDIIQSKVSACARLPELVANAEAIYHLAAAVGVELVVKSPVHTIEDNLRETQVLLKAAAPHHVPFLLTSTSEVYGKSLKDAFSEDDDLLIGPPTQSRWSYACSKLMDEFLALGYAKELALPVVIVRLFNTVGPRQTGRFGMVLPRFIAAAKSNTPLRVFGDGEQTRCFCWVNDAVEAIVRLQNCPAASGQIFNVGGTEEVSIRQLAGQVIKVLGSQSVIENIPYDQAYGPGFDDMRRRKPVIEKLFTATGFRPLTSLRKIIKQSAAISI